MQLAVGSRGGGIRRLGRTVSLARATVVAALYAVAVFVAVALVAAPTPVDVEALGEALVTAPPENLQPVPSRTGPMDASLLARYGASSASGGYIKVWRDPTRPRGVLVAVFDFDTRNSAARFLENAADSPAARRGFRVTTVEGAYGLVYANSGAPGQWATEVVFRRDDKFYIVGVVSQEREPDSARALAASQSAAAPSGDSSLPEPWQDAGRIVGAGVATIGVYLLLTSALGGRAPVAAGRRRRRRDSGVEQAGSHSVDVSEQVRRDKRVARAAFVGKAYGVLLGLPLLYRPLWPTSLELAAYGVLLYVLSVGVGRHRRFAAAALLLVSGLALPFVARGAITVLREGGGSWTRGRPRMRGYRRLFTGRRRILVASLLVVASLVGAAGLFGLALALVGDAEPRKTLSALACLGLAVLPYRRARRYSALEAAAVTGRDARSPILYLRSFGDDRLKLRARGGSPRHSTLERFRFRRRDRFEEVIAGQLWRYGPVIAVSEPGERLAPVGAARTQFDDDTWQAGVERLLSTAGLVVFTIGRTAGLAWEVGKVTELGLWDRVLIVFPPLEAAELDLRWSAFRAAAAAAGLELELGAEPGEVLVATRSAGVLVPYVGRRRDEWHYEAALAAAAAPSLGVAEEPSPALQAPATSPA